MSIISIRKAMETKGCQALLVMVGIALAVGMIATGMAPQHAQQQNPEGSTLFTVGTRKVTLKEFTDRVNQISQRQFENQGTPQAILGNHVTAVQGYVAEAATSSLASAKGVAITDANIETVAATAAKQSIDQAKAQMLMNGMIKPDASEAEADKILSAQAGGKSVPDIIKDQAAEIVKFYRDEKTKSQVITALIPEMLREKYAETSDFTEEDLKASFNEYSFSVIRFGDLEKDLTEREDLAIEALDAAKGGGDFAALQAKYAPGASNEEKAITLTAGTLESSPELAPLKNLKAGEISDVVMYGGSPTIYKLNSVKPNLPPDFDKTKANLLQNAKQSRANQALQKDLDAKNEEFKPQFEDDGLRVAYETFAEMNKPELFTNPAKLTEFLEDKRAELRDPELTSNNFPNLIAATEFIIVESLYGQATPDNKEELIDARIESANNMLQFFEDNEYRIRLADELLRDGRKDEAFSFLLQAAENNGDYESTGEATNDKITNLLARAKSEKAWDESGISTIQKELDRWQTDRNQFLQEQKEFEEEQKRAAAELDKDLANEKPPVTPPADSDGTN